MNKVIYLSETIQMIAESKGTHEAEELVQTGEIRFLKKGNETYPYLVIETETDSDK